MSYGPDDRADELARRDATNQYRPFTDESEAAGGGVVYADESEWMDEYDDEDEDGECEGHESLRGDQMGETTYCDGSCR